jgi:hypothetical protein
MHLLAAEDALCGMRRVCWIPRTITHQPALVTFLLQQDYFLTEQHVVRISCVRSNYDQCKGCCRGQTGVARHEGKSSCHEVPVYDDIISPIQVAAADIVPGQQFLRYSEACVQDGGGGTSNSCCDYVQYIQCNG